MNNSEIEVVLFNGNINKTDYECLNEIYQEAFPDEEKMGSIDDLIERTKSDKRFELEDDKFLYTKRISRFLLEVLFFFIESIRPTALYTVSSATLIRIGILSGL